MTAGARQAPCKRRRRTSERALVRCTCAVERARSEARRCALCRFVAAGVSERDRRAHTLLVARVRPQRRQDVLAGGRHALEPLRASRGRACDSARGARTRSAAPRRGRAGASGLQGRAAGGRGGAGQRGAGERRKGARGGSAGCAPQERKNACAVSARRRSEGVSGALVADRKADLECASRYTEAQILQREVPLFANAGARLGEEFAWLSVRCSSSNPNADPCLLPIEIVMCRRMPPRRRRERRSARQSRRWHR